MKWFITISPEEYGAIHFHDDDIDDARWDVDFTLKIPDNLKSGVYAARLRVDGREESEFEDFIPLSGDRFYGEGYFKSSFSNANK